MSLRHSSLACRSHLGLSIAIALVATAGIPPAHADELAKDSVDADSMSSPYASYLVRGEFDILAGFRFAADTGEGAAMLMLLQLRTYIGPLGLLQAYDANHYGPIGNEHQRSESFQVLTSFRQNFHSRRLYVEPLLGYRWLEFDREIGDRYSSGVLVGVEQLTVLTEHSYLRAHFTYSNFRFPERRYSISLRRAYFSKDDETLSLHDVGEGGGYVELGLLLESQGGYRHDYMIILAFGGSRGWGTRR